MMNPVEFGSLMIGSEIGSGGGGTVYHLADRPGWVYKEFHRDQRGNVKTHILQELVSLGSRLRLEGQPVTSVASWPTTIVQEAGRTRGFLMPVIPGAFYFDDGKLIGHERWPVYLSVERAPAWGRVTLPGPGEKRILLAHFARTLQSLHHWKVVVGDISWTNVLWTCNGSEPRTFLLDCDGFSWRGQTVLPHLMDSPDWGDPEGVGLPDADRDNYKFAVLVQRLLVGDQYDRPSPQVTADQVDVQDPEQAGAIANLLRRSAGPAGSRPTAHQWRMVLSRRKEEPVPPKPPTVPRPVPSAPQIVTTARAFRPIDPLPAAQPSRAPEPSPPDEREWRPVKRAD